MNAKNKKRKNKQKGDTTQVSGKKLKNKTYLKELARLHVELVKLQEWVKLKGLKVCVVFEGRDGAGKGGVIRLSGRKPRCMLSVISHTSRQEARWSFSTAAGTTGPGSSG
jgi:polyphosphate kinase 2 (PPK2 family)